MKYLEKKNLNSRSLKAIRLFHEIAQGARQHKWTIAFLSGFAIDAHFGYMTKNHRDVDIIISKDEAKELSEYLGNLGHSVYEALKGECLKVDQANPENTSQAHADIHYYWEEQGKVVIPLLGKKLTFSASFSEITTKRKLLGEDIAVLRPEFLAEEKKGWRDQIHLPQPPDRLKAYTEDMDKIAFLLSED